jgi:hypothetical protein
MTQGTTAVSQKLSGVIGVVLSKIQYEPFDDYQMKNNDGQN